MEPSARTMNGFTLPLDGIPVYQNGPLSLTIGKSSVNITGNWNFGFDFKKAKLDTFQLSCENLGYDTHIELSDKASAAETLPEKIGSFKKVKKPFTVYVPVFGLIRVPVSGEIEVDFRYKYSASISGALEQKIILDSKNAMNLGLKYITIHSDINDAA